MFTITINFTHFLFLFTFKNVATRKFHITYMTCIKTSIKLCWVAVLNSGQLPEHTTLLTLPSYFSTPITYSSRKWLSFSFLCLLFCSWTFTLQATFSPGWCSSVDWVQAANKGVTGSIPSQGTCLDCGLWARSLKRGAQEATRHWCFSPSLSPSLPCLYK